MEPINWCIIKTIYVDVLKKEWSAVIVDNKIGVVREKVEFNFLYQNDGDTGFLIRYKRKKYEAAGDQFYI